MKHRFIASIVVLVAGTFLRASGSDRVASTPNQFVLLPSSAYASVGMPRDAVLAQLGAPDSTLTADVWVYWNFRPKSRPAGERGDTLIVVFTQDRVSLLRLTERRKVVAALERARLKSGQKNKIAGK